LAAGDVKVSLTDQVEAMPLEVLKAWAIELKSTLDAREVQLERKFEEVVSMQEVTHQLMVTALLLNHQCRPDRPLYWGQEGGRYWILSMSQRGDQRDRVV